MKSSNPLGMMGMLLTVSTSCFVSPATGGGADHLKSQLDVVEPMQKKSSATAFRILFIGDSITRHGFNKTTTEKLGWGHIAGMAATTEKKDYAHLFSAMVQERLPEREVEIYFHSGGGSGSAAQRLSAIGEVEGLDPHLVVVQLGEHEKAVNGEAALRSNYTQLISAFDAQVPAPLMLCTGVWNPRNLERGEYTGWTATIERIMRDACKKKGIPFASVEKYAMDPTCSGWGTSKGVQWHPNDKGHAGYAFALIECYDRIKK